MRIVVGLGNPGKRYERTRHNVGFLVVDELARRGSASLRRSWRTPVQSCRAELGGQDVLLVKPQTFMNRSGPAVAAVARRKGAAPGELIVVVDDADLPLGQIRVRPQGSPGGHNGLKSVTAALGSGEFARVRVGIGRSVRGDDMVDHVLSAFSADETAVMGEAIRRAADAVEAVLRDGVDRAMNAFN